MKELLNKKKFFAYTICTFGICVICFNFYNISKKTLLNYLKPVDKRFASAKWNMGSIIDLVDNNISDDEKEHILLGIYFPADDPVTENHFNMVLSYHLFPTKTITAGRKNLKVLDAITGYEASLFELNYLLEHAGIKEEFTYYTKDRCFFLVKPDFKRENEKKDPPFSSNIACFVRLFCSLFAVFPLGFLISHILFMNTTFNSNIKGYKWLFAWNFGILFVVLLSMLLGMMGIKFLHPAILGCFFILSLFLCYFFLRKEKKKELNISKNKKVISPRYRIGVTVLSIISIVVFILFFFQALSIPVAHLTGLGVWGLKARAFFEIGGIDFDFLNDPHRHYCHGSYPLGFPLFLAYCFSWMGAFDDWAIKLVPVIMGFSFAGMLLFIFGKLKLDLLSSLSFVLLFCTGPTFFDQSRYLQAETMLLLFSLVGYYFLMEYLFCKKNCFLWGGFLFLAGASCIKQEGIIYFFIGITVTFLLSRGFFFKNNRKTALIDIIILGTIISLFILPWQVYWRINQIIVNDFDYKIIFERTLSQNMVYLWEGWKMFFELMFLNISSTSLIWYFVILAGSIYWRQIIRNPRLKLLLFSSFMLVFFFSSVYIFSVYTGFRIKWHLQASDRLLLFPTVLCLIMFVALLKGGQKELVNEKNQKKSE